MAIGQSSLGIVNLLNLDLDVLYQISFFKKECEHLHAAFSCRDTSLPSSKRSQLTITNFKKTIVSARLRLSAIFNFRQRLVVCVSSSQVSFSFVLRFAVCMTIFSPFGSKMSYDMYQIFFFSRSPSTARVINDITIL